MLPLLLHQSYLFTAILGIGITAIDMLGLLGAHHGDQSTGHDHTIGHDHNTGYDHNTDAGHNAGHADHNFAPAMDHSTGLATDHTSGQIADHSTNLATNHGPTPASAANLTSQPLAQHSPLALADGPSTGLSKLLTALRYFRLFVYFSIGYGPVGLMAEYLGFSWWAALLWAIGSGLAIGALSRAFFQFQQRDVDSTVQTVDLFLGTATVIVPITAGNMGKVRVQIGQSIAERYAVAEEAHENFPAQTVVDIVRVTDDCVYVRRAGSLRANNNSVYTNKINNIDNLNTNNLNTNAVLPEATDFTEHPTSPMKQPQRRTEQ
jgi:membrane protein implicated in regulation of membrane protease activity